MAALRQPSFAGGELGETLWGRTDLARHAVAVRYARDFLVTKTGALQNRGGFVYLGDALNIAGERSRLTPFVYSDTVSYVLEWCRYKLRVWTNGYLVTSGGVPLQLDTPYSTDELSALRYVQSGDVLTLTHPAHPPHELRRKSATEWELTEVVFTRPPFYSYAEKPRMREYGSEEEGAPNPSPNYGDKTHAAHEWKYKVTTVGERGDGSRFESTPFTVREIIRAEDEEVLFAPAKFAPASDAPVWLTWASQGQASTPWEYVGVRILSFRFYRGRGTIFGYLGEAGGFEFYDDGVAPDYAQPPPQGRNPFNVYAYAAPDSPGTLLRTEYPATCAYHSDRLWFGATLQRPTTLWGSRSGDYGNFDSQDFSTEDEAVEVTFASRTREEVRWLASREDLLVGTSGSVWALSAADGSYVKGNETPFARVESSQGCAAVEPVQVGDSVLFVGAKGGGLHSLHPVENKRAWAADDVGLWAPHLPVGVRELAYTEEDSVLWVLRAGDGKLAALTYSRGQELAAWTLHATGWIESICAVPEGGRDALYACVLRFVKESNGDSTQVRYIERLEPHRADAVHGVFLDSSIKAFDVEGQLSGLTHLRGLEVMLVLDGAPYGPFTVPDSGVLPLPVPYAEWAVVGLPYVPSLETLDAAFAKSEVSARSKIVSHVSFELVASSGFFAGERLDEADGFTEWPQREVQHGYGMGPLHTGLVTLPVLSAWNTGGRAALQQRRPLPLTITGMVREVVLGG